MLAVAEACGDLAQALITGIVVLIVDNGGHDGRLCWGDRGVSVALECRGISLPLAQTEKPLEAAGIDLVLAALHHGLHVEGS